MSMLLLRSQLVMNVPSVQDNIVPYHRLGVIARAGERGSRARSAKDNIDEILDTI